MSNIYVPGSMLTEIIMLIKKKEALPPPHGRQQAVSCLKKFSEKKSPRPRCLLTSMWRSASSWGGGIFFSRVLLRSVVIHPQGCSKSWWCVCACVGRDRERKRREVPWLIYYICSFKGVIRSRQQQSEDTHDEGVGFRPFLR